MARVATIVHQPERAARPSLLVCPPTDFNAHFLFNPFMSYRERVDLRRAKAQWRRLVRVLEEAGADVDVAEPAPSTGAVTFTADGAFCYAPGRALVLRNDGVRGELEPPVVRDWLAGRGFATEALPPTYRLDGGNLLQLRSGDVLAGLKPNATGLGERYLARLLRLVGGGRVIPIPLVDRRHLHLDTAVGVLGDAFLVYPNAFPGGRVPDEPPFASAEVVVVGEDDASCFGCNVVVVGDVVVTGPVSDALARRIGRLGYAVERVDLSEFYKAGGGAKCLTLPLWRRPTEGGT